MSNFIPRATTLLIHAVIKVNPCPWWRHQMETFSASLALCVGNSPVPGGFPAQRPVTRSFDVFFDLCLNKRLSKQSWGWWFKTPSCPLWRYCNVSGAAGTMATSNVAEQRSYCSNARTVCSWCELVTNFVATTHCLSVLMKRSSIIVSGAGMICYSSMRIYCLRTFTSSSRSVGQCLGFTDLPKR